MKGSPSLKSDISDTEGGKDSRQVGKRNPEFAERLNGVMEGHEQAQLSRDIGVSKSTIGDYRKGSMPAGDKLLRLADRLGVEPRWLAMGVGPVRGPDADAWVDLPRYDLLSFGEYGKPAPTESIPVRRDLLGRWASAAGLWLAVMPTSSEVAEEGELVLCRDPEQQLVDGRVYAALIDGRLVVRRVQIRPQGLALKMGVHDPDPITISPDQIEQFMPIARILAAISPQPV